MNEFDIIIVGAGPAGSSAALFAGREGLKTLLVDKASFPRDKVCGDALSGKTLGILRKLQLTEAIDRIPQVKAHGVIFSSPRGDSVNIRFKSDRENHYFHGYVSRRMHFDDFMFRKAAERVDAALTGFRLTEVLADEQGRVIGIEGIPAGEATPQKYYGKIVIGADGYKSVVARKRGMYQYDSLSTLVALRAYYRNVSGLTDSIEIHFVKEALPGYFWIFPLPDNMANVGIGMRHSDIKKRRIDLQAVLQNTIQSPDFRPRFAAATPVGKIKGWNLPTGNIFRKNHDAGLLLIGDAAGLVDPFTGEGIGNAMTSAEIAIRVAARAIAENDLSRERLAEYDRLLRDELQNELTLSYRLQQIGIRYPFLLNLVVKKAARNPQVADWISSMIASESAKQDLTTPLTYLKLLWA